MRPFFSWKRSRRPSRMALAVEALEDRRQPATLVAPDLLSQSDTGFSSFDNLTRNALPMFAGTTTSSTGAQISLLIDDAPVAAFPVKRVGGSSFRLQPTAPLAEGSHVARFYDSQTQTLSSALAFNVDASPPPVPPAPQLVSSVDAAHLVVAVRGVAGDRVHLFIAGHDMATTQATGSPQNVSVDITGLGLDPFMPFVVTLVAEDAAGNRSEASGGLSVTLQTAPPPPPTDLRLDAASDTGVDDHDGITAETTLSFSGTALPGQKITLFVDGTAGNSQVAGADGTFLISSGLLAAGAHEAWVTAANGNGPAGDASSHVTVTIDTTPPVISDIAIEPSNVSPNNDGANDKALFHFTLSESAYVAVYFLDSENFNLGEIPLGVIDAGLQEFDLDVPEFTEGAYTIIVVASDVADNVGDFAQVPFTVDLTPSPAPTFALAAGQDSGISATDRLTNVSAPQFVGVSEPGTTIELRDGATTLGTALAAADGTWSLAALLGDGDHLLSAIARDPAGNATVGDQWTITIDATPPAVDAGADRTGMEGTPVTLTAPVSDAHAIVEETWSLASSSNGASMPNVQGPSLTFTPSAAGVYVFRHAAKDAAGNVGEDAVTLTVQGAAPILQVTWPSGVNLGAPFVVDLGVTGNGVDGWSISWGDGAHDDLPGAATSAAHVYEAAGSYTPTVAALFGTQILPASGSPVVVQAVQAPTNQAPTLTNLIANAPDAAEDASSPDGVTIAALASSLGILDSPGSLAGLAITSADSTHGAWQYALDGATWSPLGAVSDALARLLAADDETRIRFLPAADWSGGANLTARAWDQSDHRANGTQGNSEGAGSFSNESATIKFTVTAVNDAPVLALPQTPTVYRNTEMNIGAGLSLSDIDSTRLRITISIDEGVIIIPSTQGLTFATGSGTPNLTLDGPADVLNTRLAALIYRPTPGYIGPVTIGFSATDLGLGGGAGGAGVATGTLAFDVVNRPPQIVGTPSFTMNANTTLNVTAPGLAGAFVDLDRDAFTIALASPPPVGVIVVNPDGGFRYTPPPNFIGTVTFAVRAYDGIDTSPLLWVTIQVKSVYGLRR
jgi:hypothetical protein